MTRDLLTRRRLLTGLGGLVAVGVGGWAAAARAPADSAPASTTSSMAIATPTTTEPSHRSTTTIAPTTTTTEPPLEIEVTCRASWGALEPQGEMTEHTITCLTLHHTAALLTDDVDPRARARAHQRFHLDSGFADIAYHYLVDLEGNVLEGRSVAHAGETFTDYDPTGHFLVCCEGNYDEQEPTRQQLDAVARLFAWASLTFDVDIATLSGHRDHARTSCPGENLYQVLEDGTLAIATEAAATSKVTLIERCG
jgi:hypothetical protein